MDRLVGTDPTKVVASQFELPTVPLYRRYDSFWLDTPFIAMRSQVPWRPANWVATDWAGAEEMMFPLPFPGPGPEVNAPITRRPETRTITATIATATHTMGLRAEGGRGDRVIVISLSAGARRRGAAYFYSRENKATICIQHFVREAAGMAPPHADWRASPGLLALPIRGR